MVSWKQGALMWRFHSKALLVSASRIKSAQSHLPLWFVVQELFRLLGKKMRDAGFVCVCIGVWKEVPVFTSSWEMSRTDCLHM